MTKRPLPPDLASTGGAKSIDARAYLRLAIEVLAEVDPALLDAAGRVAYAQALALVAIGANTRAARGYLDELGRVVGLYIEQHG